MAIMQILAIATCVANFIVVGIRFSELPETIPTHFGIDGTPDAWGSKSIIWLLPGVALFTLVIMYFAQTTGSVNVPASMEESSAIEMLRHLDFSTQVLLFILSYLSIEVAMGRRDGLGKSFLVFTLVLVLYPFYFMIK
jgi:uncharacterized membrane protein